MLIIVSKGYLDNEGEPMSAIVKVEQSEAQIVSVSGAMQAIASMVLNTVSVRSQRDYGRA